MTPLGITRRLAHWIATSEQELTYHMHLSVTLDGKIIIVINSQI